MASDSTVSTEDDPLYLRRLLTRLSMQKQREVKLQVDVMLSGHEREIFERLRSQLEAAGRVATKAEVMREALCRRGR
jgi:hypothetical protein